MRRGLGHKGLSLTALLAFDANVHVFRDFISFCNSGGLVTLRQRMYVLGYSGRPIPARKTEAFSVGLGQVFATCVSNNNVPWNHVHIVHQ
jgi:hypothetical protein